MSHNPILLHSTVNTPFDHDATKPEIHTAAAQQGIFQAFKDATIAGELKTKWAMLPDVNWDAGIHMVEEMM